MYIHIVTSINAEFTLSIVSEVTTIVPIALLNMDVSFYFLFATITARCGAG